ncbi:MAG TPA: hypothetical protein VGR71_03630 [Nitrospira sp.]|nr:hypothetical protein [Nitrospira sp.]HEV2336812.1 hypothetical protein [Stellaceae bacterium]
MNPEAIHIFAPPVVGILFTILSHSIERLILTKVREHLHLLELPTRPGFPTTRPEKFTAAAVDGITEIVKAASTLITFIANCLVFIGNYFIGLSFFVSDDIVYVSAVGLIIVIGVFMQILTIFVRYDIRDTVDIAWKFKKSIRWWLQAEEIAFNCLVVLYFFIGYHLGYQTATIL